MSGNSRLVSVLFFVFAIIFVSAAVSAGGDTSDTTIPPVITLLGSNPVTVGIGTPYIDAGATALDDIDGNITSSIVTINPVDTTTLGTYIVTYDVTDSSGNPATQATRTVNVVSVIEDTQLPADTPPVITLLGTDPVTIETGTTYIDAGATALDDIDGDITSSIVTVNPVDTTTLGTYTITYDVTDSSGNPATQATRTVNIVAPVPPAPQPPANNSGGGSGNGGGILYNALNLTPSNTVTPPATTTTPAENPTTTPPATNPTPINNPNPTTETTNPTNTTATTPLTGFSVLGIGGTTWGYLLLVLAAIVAVFGIRGTWKKR